MALRSTYTASIWPNRWFRDASWIRMNTRRVPKFLWIHYEISLWRDEKVHGQRCSNIHVIDTKYGLVYAQQSVGRTLNYESISVFGAVNVVGGGAGGTGLPCGSVPRNSPWHGEIEYFFFQLRHAQYQAEDGGAFEATPGHKPGVSHAHWSGNFPWISLERMCLISATVRDNEQKYVGTLWI